MVYHVNMPSIAVTLFSAVSLHTSAAFVTTFNTPRISNEPTSLSKRYANNESYESKIDCSITNRRSILAQLGLACTAPFLPSLTPPALAETMEDTATTAAVNTVPMKNFIDPKGLFAIRIPQSYFTLRRTAKGDLPDAKTGKGRRGSSIFTAGDMAKAEVVAVELFPTHVLLEDEGIDASGDLSTFDKLGKPLFIAQLLNIRREKEKGGQSKSTVVEKSVRLSEDNKSLYFELRTEIDVQKPELLMEQMGVSELTRITLGRAELRSNNDQMMVCYASALDVDYNGADGLALKEVIDSFIAVDQASKELS